MRNYHSFALFLLFKLFCLSLYGQQPCGGPPNQIPPAESCETACVYCSFQNYAGSTGGYGASGANACFDIENDQWLGFTATSASATFTVTPSNCANGNGVQIALYSACASAPIACNTGAAGQGNIPTSVTTALTPGDTYFLMIDGYLGDVCNFTITSNPPQGNPMKLGNMQAIQGPASTCPGSEVAMQVNAVSNAGTYTWTGPPGFLFNGEPSPANISAPGGNKVTVTTPGSGIGANQICVKVSNICEQGATQCKTLTLQPIPPTIWPPVTVCFEDMPYILPWDEDVNKIGTFDYQTTLTSYQGCDSVLRQRVTIKPPLVVNLGTKVICEGKSISICGDEFSAPGVYQTVCQSFQGCDSVVNVQVVVLNTTAKILYDGSGIACSGTGTVTLRSAPAPAGTIKRWQANGVPLGVVSDSLVVSKPGTYQLISRIIQAGVFCETTDAVTVIMGKAASPPVLQASSTGPLTCMQKNTELSVSSTPKAISFQWDGPGVVAAKTQNIKVSLPGEYTATVVDTNGCKGSTKLTVPLIMSLPNVTVTKSPLGGLGVIGRLIAKTDVANPQFLWSGPSGFSSDFSNPVIFEVGVYYVTVTNPANGCSAAATYNVTKFQNPPTEKRSMAKPEFGDELWRIYPNPAHGELNLEYLGAQMPDQVQLNIYDALGKLCRATSAMGDFVQKIELHNMQPGMYVLELLCDEQPIRLRFVVR